MSTGRSNDDKPASAPDVMPPHERPPREEDGKAEGSTTIEHYPDPSADRRPSPGDERKPRGPYVTGND